VGDSIIDTITVTTAAGISPFINNSFKIALYPNPTEDLLYLKYNESIISLEQVRIYDLLGRTMLTKTSSFSTIDIGSLSDGLYFLEAINADENLYVTQFVKAR
jgi:lysyl endopeptidase